ncbi:butyrophilin subfamily 3 member A1-like [Neolamprologus brichardi]|uniref:butyrophilin subfamily 3 member A1-like n=1 Tax=Neolamprologus brichardi TaxID=32507 RepID=UPI001643942B|nr:butyrophilin subfamily 3 member A1-like [Neolamprologus brichardi]
MDLFDRCSVLVFYTAAVFVLIHSCRGQSEVIGPLQPVVALIGDDIILPCNLDPVMNALDMAVEWARLDLNPRFVLVWRDGVELESKKHPSYTNRTSLFTDELKNGNISLKISKVKLSDEGTYKCFVPELKRQTTVKLVVGAASSPAAEINKTSSRVVLQCESAGWYPEPELLWLDGEGNLLSAGPTETLRGPDDLYTVSSRVTVEKRHSNNITCRVQQRNTNQSRETHIHVPDDFFVVIGPSSPPSNPTNDPNINNIGLVIGVLVVLFLILAVIFVVWKKRQAKLKNKKSEEEGAETGIDGESAPLMTGREEENDVASKKEQRHEDGIETKKDEFVSETEQMKDINSPQNSTINPSTVIGKESLIKIEQETQDMTGREEEGNVDNSGEKNIQKKKKQSKEVDTDSSGTKTCIVTETDPQFEMKQETHEEEEVTGRGMKAEGAESEREKTVVPEKGCIDLLPPKEKPKEPIVFVKEGKTFKRSSFTELIEELKSLTSHLSIDQEPWREKETQEQLVEKRQMERNVDTKKSDTEKQRAEENSDEVNLNSEVMAQKETEGEKLEAEQHREENQRLQSETRREREKDETELKIRKDNNNQHHTKKLQEISEEESQNAATSQFETIQWTNNQQILPVQTEPQGSESDEDL